jgi:shikimate dehydrogenase
VRITAQTRIAGVVGNPVRHSLSPIIHNAWIDEAELDAVYLAFEPPKERFRQFIDGLRGGLVLGLNVTIPFKEEALAVADDASEAAGLAGAANLLVFRPDGAVEADNTDGEGMILSLVEAGFVQRPGAESRAVILGAGGAARGAAAALIEAGVARIDIVNRSVARAEELALMDPSIVAHGWGEALETLESASLVINATSLGMNGQPPLELSLDPLPRNAIVMDMVYRPLTTPLLKQAKARGNAVVDGLSMLINQAAPSFLQMVGRRPPDAVDVRAMCLDVLGEAS